MIFVPKKKVPDTSPYDTASGCISLTSWFSQLLRRNTSEPYPHPDRTAYLIFSWVGSAMNNTQWFCLGWKPDGLMEHVLIAHVSMCSDRLGMGPIIWLQVHVLICANE